MWNPIETAPKGRRFLGAYTINGKLWALEVCGYNVEFDCCVTSVGKAFPATHWRESPPPPGAAE